MGEQFLQPMALLHQQDSVSEEEITMDMLLMEEQGPTSDKRGAKFRNRMAKMKPSMKNNVKNI